MAADAQLGRIQLLRRNSAGIVGVFGQRPVTGFTIHLRMLAFAFQVQNVRVAGFAGLMSGIRNGLGFDLSQRIAAKVPILPKTFGHKIAPYQNEDKDPGGKNPRQTEKMSCVFKFHGVSCDFRSIGSLPAVRVIT